MSLKKKVSKNYLFNQVTQLKTISHLQCRPGSIRKKYSTVQRMQQIQWGVSEKIYCIWNANYNISFSLWSNFPAVWRPFLASAKPFCAPGRIHKSMPLQTRANPVLFTSLTIQITKGVTHGVLFRFLKNGIFYFLRVFTWPLKNGILLCQYSGLKRVIILTSVGNNE